jgi:hypothetical protein
MTAVPCTNDCTQRKRESLVSLCRSAMRRTWDALIEAFFFVYFKVRIRLSYSCVHSHVHLGQKLELSVLYTVVSSYIHRIFILEKHTMSCVCSKM